MTVLTRGARPRRSGRRPGWLLLTVLLVLAIVASSALVFTDRVELLKLAVILALWAAVVAAFVSVIYRRQSDVDQAKARDLKLVYDLQLDREISARREYELTVETQLRRELASELRAQAADEVAALRAELAALRANLEYPVRRRPESPACDRDRTCSGQASATGPGRPIRRAGLEQQDRHRRRTPTPGPKKTRSSTSRRNPMRPNMSGRRHRCSVAVAHRRPSEAEPTPEERLAVGGRGAAAEHRCGRRSRAASRAARRRRAAPGRAARRRRRAAHGRSSRAGRTARRRAAAAEQRGSRATRREPSEAGRSCRRAAPQSADWQPAPAEGQWIPAGTPGSNWSPSAAENGSSGEYVARRRAPSPRCRHHPPSRAAAVIPRRRTHRSGTSGLAAAATRAGNTAAAAAQRSRADAESHVPTTRRRSVR